VVARPAVALLVLSIFSGCSGPPEAGPDEVVANDAASDGLAGNLTNETDVPRLMPWSRVSVYFTEEGMSFEPPEAGSTVVATPATFLVGGFDARSFATPPLAHAVYIMPEAVDATLYIRSAGPQVSTGLDFGIWGGSSKAIGLDYFGPGTPVTPPGEAQEVQITIPFGDRRGFVVPAGESIEFLIVGPVGREWGQPELLVGGDTPSHVELTLANFTVDPVAGSVPAPAEDIGAPLTGTIPVFCPPPPGDVIPPIAIDVDERAAWIEIVVEAASPNYDTDIQLFHDDTLVARGITPRGYESVYLAAEALEGLQGQRLELVVTACGAGPSSYSGSITQGLFP
jgi:hypothetical protein